MKRLLLHVFILICGWLHAQTSSFVQYSVEEGMVQSQVQSLTQDQHGNLWVTVSIRDSKNDIWFGHWAGGVSRFNSQSQKFESLNLEEYTRFKTVTAIVEDQQGYYWIATEGAGIFIYYPLKNSMYTVTVNEGIPSMNVYDLCLDGNGNMWIATDRGLTICDTKSDFSSPQAYEVMNAQRGFPSDVITCICKRRKRNLDRHR